MGASAGGRRAAERALALDEGAVDAHEVIARAAIGLERWPEARQALERTLTLDATRAPLHFELARVLERLEEADAARAAYERALEADVEPTASRLALARLALDAEDREAARRWLDAAEADAAEDPSYQTSRERLASLDAAEAERAEAAQAELGRLGDDQAGALGILEALNGGWNSRTNPFGQAPVSPDPMPALGGLMGDQIGSNFGFGGLGRRGAARDSDEEAGRGRVGGLGALGGGGSGGGGGGYGVAGSGRSGLGAVGGASPSPSVRALATVEGDGAIQAAVGRLRARFNSCAQQGATRSSSLSGSASYRVIAGADGVEVRTASSSLDEAGTEACFASTLRSMLVAGERREATVTVRVER